MAQESRRTYDQMVASCKPTLTARAHDNPNDHTYCMPTSHEEMEIDPQPLQVQTNTESAIRTYAEVMASNGLIDIKNKQTLVPQSQTNDNTVKCVQGDAPGVSADRGNMHTASSEVEPMHMDIDHSYCIMDIDSPSPVPQNIVKKNVQTPIQGDHTYSLILQPTTPVNQSVQTPSQGDHTYSLILQPTTPVNQSVQTPIQGDHTYSLIAPTLVNQSKTLQQSNSIRTLPGKSYAEMVSKSCCAAKNPSAPQTDSVTMLQGEPIPMPSDHTYSISTGNHAYNRDKACHFSTSQNTMEKENNIQSSVPDSQTLLKSCAPFLANQKLSEVMYNFTSSTDIVINGISFKIQNVPGDCNCYFHSISPFFNNRNHIDLRQDICSQVCSHFEQWKPLVHLHHGVQTNQSSYSSKMIYSFGWATDVEIKATAIALNCTINVYMLTAHQGKAVKVTYTPFNTRSTTTVNILLSNNHFRCLRIVNTMPLQVKQNQSTKHRTITQNTGKTGNRKTAHQKKRHLIPQKHTKDALLVQTTKCTAYIKARVVCKAKKQKNKKNKQQQIDITCKPPENCSDTVHIPNRNSKHNHSECTQLSDTTHTVSNTCDSQSRHIQPPSLTVFETDQTDTTHEVSNTCDSQTRHTQPPPPLINSVIDRSN